MNNTQIFERLDTLTPTEQAEYLERFFWTDLEPHSYGVNIIRYEDATGELVAKQMVYLDDEWNQSYDPVNSYV